jgi:glycosyltransferase involved in cell wall biosynthesis
MNILHFIPSVDPRVGGPMRATVDLAKALAAKGHAVTIATTDQPSTTLECHGDKEALKLLCLGKLDFFGQVLSKRSLARIEREILRTDVVHTHGPWEYANVQVCRLAARLHKPYVVSLHGMLDDWPMRQRRLKKRLFLALLGNRHLCQAARIHLSTQLEFEQSRRWFRQERAIVIPDYLDLDAFRVLPEPALIEASLKPLNENTSKVLFLSRLHPKKGLEILIRAAAILKARGRPISLIIAGDGTQKYVAALKTLAQVLDIRSTEILFLGTVTGASKLALFCSCDVFALPTYHENFGFVLVESLASGLPLVTTSVVALSLELSSSGAAIVTEATPRHFADAIDSLLTDPKALRVKRELGRRWVFEFFDPQDILSRYENMYRACADDTI